jgi:hypothetical protein
MNIGTLLETPERVDDDRRALKLKKLLGSRLAHARALPGGGDDRNIHKSKDEGGNDERNASMT